MDKDEHTWIDDAISLCETASRKNVTLLLVRSQDSNDEADCIVTNAKDAKMVAALNGNCETETEGEDE